MVKAGLAFLPMTAAIGVTSGAATAVIMFVALIITVATIRIRRADLARVNPI